MDIVVKYANDFWNLWLAILFVSIVIYALWPTKKRGDEMKHAANIPLMDEEPHDSKNNAKGV